MNSKLAKSKMLEILGDVGLSRQFVTLNVLIIAGIFSYLNGGYYRIAGYLLLAISLLTILGVLAIAFKMTRESFPVYKIIDSKSICKIDDPVESRATCIKSFEIRLNRLTDSIPIPLGVGENLTKTYDGTITIARPTPGSGQVPKPEVYLGSHFPRGTELVIRFKTSIDLDKSGGEISFPIDNWLNPEQNLIEFQIRNQDLKHTYKLQPFARTRSGKDLTSLLSTRQREAPETETLILEWTNEQLRKLAGKEIIEIGWTYDQKE